MFFFENLLTEMARLLFRQASGRLLTEDQIRSITGNTVGRYFTEWLPVPKLEQDAQRRVEQAREHITSATAIITSLRADLDTQAEQLEGLVKEIKVKSEQANRYSAIASANAAVIEAFRREMTESLRQELVEQANKGKAIRRTASIIIWLFTIFAGAALGTYFPHLVALIKR